MADVSPRTTGIQVTPAALLERFGDAFSSRISVVTELAQNARRSGANRVDIVLTGDSLVVTDDGAGVSDFDALLGVVASGWDMDVMARESPMGCGFLACLYAGERIEVSSRHGSIEADTRELLSMQRVPIHAGHNAPGTRVCVRRLHEGLHPDAVRRALKGFAIPVTVNRELIERPHAIDVLDTTSSMARHELPGVGVYFCGQGEAPGDRAKLYLQGLPIEDERMSDAAVLHLEDGAFHPVMPDRARLQNADEARAHIGYSIAQAQHDWLVAHWAGLSTSQRNRYSAMIQRRGLARLWNTCDELPEDAVVNLDSPRCRVLCPGDHHASAWEWWDYAVPQRSDFAEGRYRAMDYEALEAAGWLLEGYMETGADQAKRLCHVHYLQALGIVPVVLSRLDAGHWVHAYVSEVPAPSVAIHDIQGTSVAVANPIRFHTDIDKVQVANAITLDGPLGRVTLEHDALIAEVGEQLIYVVMSASNTEEMADYNGEFHYNDGDCETDQCLLTDLVRCLCAGSGAQFLQEQLREFRPVLRDFGDGEYRLTVVDGEATVELVDKAA